MWVDYKLISLDVKLPVVCTAMEEAFALQIDFPSFIINFKKEIYNFLLYGQ